MLLCSFEELQSNSMQTSTGFLFSPFITEHTEENCTSFYVSQNSAKELVVDPVDFVDGILARSLIGEVIARLPIAKTRIRSDSLTSRMLKNFNTWQARRPDEFVCSSLYKLCRKFSVTNTLQLFFADALPMRRLGWTRLGAIQDIAYLSIKSHDRGILSLCRPTSGLAKSSDGE